jgi:hypothetical protein
MSRTQKQELRAELRCCICGQFIAYSNFDSGAVGWYDPTGVQDFEPKEELPFHVRCKENV